MPVITAGIGAGGRYCGLAVPAVMVRRACECHEDGKNQVKHFKKI